MATMNSDQVSITAVSWVLGTVTLVVVSMRLFSRLVARGRAGWDDVFITLSLVSALVCSALVQTAVSYGLGRHAKEITDPDRKILAFKYTVIAPNFSIISTTAGKISATIFLLRLMGQSATRARRWFLYILTVASVAWNTLCIIAVIGFCRPAEKIWNTKVEGSCFSLEFQLIVATSQAAFNAFNDIALAVFPAYIFWRIQIPLKVKITIVAVMGAGVFAAAATLVKCILLKDMPVHSDITASWVDITLWYTIEMYIIVICATLPSLRQSYAAVLNHSRKISAYTRSHHTPQQKQSIPLKHRSLDASLFATSTPGPSPGPSAENRSRHSSQEYILDSTVIHKITEVLVVQEDASEEVKTPHFPRSNPFRTDV
ncbi:hypothetical protein N7492_004685 [Penicillium capsulatum]|uniref:Rhodopsin domain-containing protein n=1 Tax=Penicillium capsulatum TaxID=69766 RepID=A0A9W9LQF9_9EURO|nr:hypothetical protein N7492_004685 [Penicillium capsulatum]KAJ6136205.1 hypothetical protein N7512_001365 [Penicillium capsulatum]